MLESKNISHIYPGNKQFLFPDLLCQKGESWLITGDSGSGKTTFLHVLAGILKPSGGTVTINDTVFSMLDGKKADGFRGRYIGMIFQHHFFLKGLSVYDNLLAAGKLAGVKPDQAYLHAMMSALGIEALKGQMPETLSQGEQQRFSIARALANKPLLVLADEPTSSLDDKNCEQFVACINQQLPDHRPCWIIATHDHRLKKFVKNVIALNPINA